MPLYRYPIASILKSHRYGYQLNSLQRGLILRGAIYSVRAAYIANAL